MIDIVEIKNAKYLEFYSNDGCIYCKNKITDEVVLVAEDEKYKILKKEYLDCQKWYKEEKNKNIKQKEVIDKIFEKCQSKNKNYDYNVWMKLNDSWNTLSDFAEYIKYILHPIITDAYRCDIKNSINEIIGTTKYDVVFKEDILDILKEITEIKQDTMNGIERN